MLAGLKQLGYAVEVELRRAFEEYRLVGEIGGGERVEQRSGILKKSCVFAKQLPMAGNGRTDTNQAVYARADNQPRYVGIEGVSICRLMMYVTQDKCGGLVRGLAAAQKIESGTERGEIGGI